MTDLQPTLGRDQPRAITPAGYRGAVSAGIWRDRVDDRTESERVEALEAWAFRAGRDLAEIKGALSDKATSSSVDALHQDVVALREEVRTGFDEIRKTQASHSSTLREILSMLGSLHDHITRG